MTRNAALQPQRPRYESRVGDERPMTDQPLLSSYFGILPQMPEGTILRLLIETAIQVLDADEGSLLVYDEPSKSLRFAMTVGDEESAAKLAGQSVPIGKGLVGLAALSREVQVGAPTFHDVKQTRKKGGRAGEPEAEIVAPMIVADALIGVLTVVSFRHGKRFSGADAKLYARYAAIAALVVDQRRRLAAIEAKDHALLSGAGASERSRAEQKIFESIGKIVKHDHSALPHLAQMLSALSALVISDPGHRR